MGNVNSDESQLRGGRLGGADDKKAVDHNDRTRNPDTKLRVDGEEDTLYDDGIELEDDSRPLTGVDGKDDSVSNTDKGRV